MRKITPLHETELKKGKIVIIIDTRETKPISFIKINLRSENGKKKQKNPKERPDDKKYKFSNNVYVGSHALSVGDYMVGTVKENGNIKTLLLFERKTLSDLRATMKDDTRRRNLRELIAIGKHTHIETMLIIEEAQKKLGKFRELSDGSIKGAASSGMSITEMNELTKTLANLSMHIPVVYSIGISNTLKLVEDMSLSHVRGAYKCVDLPRTPTSFKVSLFDDSFAVVAKGNHPGSKKPPPIYFGIDQINTKYLQFDDAEVLCRQKQIELSNELTAYTGINKTGKWIGFLYNSYLDADKHAENTYSEIMNPITYKKTKMSGIVLSFGKYFIEEPAVLDLAEFEVQLCALYDCGMVGRWTRYDHLFVLSANLYSIMDKNITRQTFVAPLSASSSWEVTLAGLLVIHYLTLEEYNATDLDIPLPIGLAKNLIEDLGASEAAKVVANRMNLQNHQNDFVKKTLTGFVNED